MLFGKKNKGNEQSVPFQDEGPLPSPEVFHKLETLKKAGVQLSLRFTSHEAYTSEILGLGRDGFFIDTLTPPAGDRQARKGRSVEIQSILEGVSYGFKSEIVGKVQFLDELPAFKLLYPAEVLEEARRKTARLNARGTSRITFIRPFSCDASVEDIGLGGLSFEYPAETGRLAPGTRLGGAVLELGPFGLIELRADVVGTLVASIGGLSLPATYRSGIKFQSLGESEKNRLTEYLKSL